MTDSTPAESDYPLDVFAARLRWLLRTPAVEVTFDDWRAGPLAIAHLGNLRLVYGGDTAEEGSIGVSVMDAEHEGVEGIAGSDGTGWIEAESWDALRTKVDAIPRVPVVPQVSTDLSGMADIIDRFLFDHPAGIDALTVARLRSAEEQLRTESTERYVAANPHVSLDAL